MESCSLQQGEPWSLLVIVSFLIVATLKLVKENLSSERERSVRTDQQEKRAARRNRREHHHADGYPNFTKNSGLEAQV